MKVIVLDMDETLYDERQFVEGGFRAVAAYASRRWGINKSAAYRLMRSELAKKGRGKIFDALLKRYGAYSKPNVRACLSAYRSHKPRLRLYPDAVGFFKRFKKYPIYVVTDGNLAVQRRKARALGLTRMAKQVIVAMQYGKNKAKPSPYVFRMIARREGVDPRRVVHVGDDPYKDFVNLKPLGFQTTRILRGRFKRVRLGNKYEAHRNILSLNEL